MIFGLDFLFAPRYEKLAVRSLPLGFATGCFWKIAGDSISFTKKVLDKGCPHFRSAGLWEDNHNFGDGHIKELKKMARALQAIAVVNKHATIEISGFCEHNLKNPDKYLDIVKQEAPDCIPVNTPDKGALSRKYKNETHHSNKKLAGKYNYSFDGVSCVDADVEKIKEIHKSADVFFFWVPQFNGRKTTKDTTPRPQRKAWPTSELIDSVIYLHNNCGKVKMPKNYLNKSHAEQHVVPAEPRAFKPVFIIPPKAARIELVAANGQVVAVSGGPQSYEDGRFRYYFSQYGYQIAEKAMRIQGHPVLKVKVANQIKGTTNPAFRQGNFR